MKLLSSFRDVFVAFALVALLLAGHSVIDKEPGTSLFFPPHTKRIVVNPGGSVFDFIEDMSNDRNNHVNYIIDGPCISACTFVLGEIPPERVCVTPYAMMAFHSAYAMEETLFGKKRVFDAEINDMIWRIYPAWVDEWLKSHGWANPYVDQKTLMWMGNDELRKHYKLCDNSTR